MSEDAVRRPTIVEVARLAQVSHQTVSRYLRHNGGLKPETVRRVEAAIEELGYRPNLVARSMRTRRTGRLAVLLPANVAALPTRLLGAAATAAHEAGFLMEIVTVEGGPQERTDRARDLITSGQVEGVLSLSSLPGLSDRPSTPSSAACVVVGEYDEELRGIGELADGSMVGEIIEHLAGLGHRDFLHVAGPETWASARARRAVYLEVVDRLGLTSHGVVDGDWSARAGYDAIHALPATSPVTAVIAANDPTATGVVRAALERGWGVPEHLSVVGWDDAELVQYATPSLSSVAVDREGQGTDAMRRLIALVRGEEPPAPVARPLNRLMLRESTGPAQPGGVKPPGAAGGT
ncbi:LacI family DNA-binding transcriptional regulator [Promicromonospora thailandica]|uniref:Transcriptional regulator, LacI family n=1 Tax=Promicromonospora thailandica TaxID=765201 RepID=A0A9X2JVN4_9MICO|nr:LacI family DNA-binding transcriptional regulator [Promicromonospora thailandica]MCP2265770.1 transcriptional regulator, LacI family [Promicromonospora thailandica]BFF21791.1 LacI family DNA-binding transcriptional regulator [Promicromonospora thailandica]